MKIEAKHIGWVFDVAANHYQKEVERLENEIARHGFFADEPLVTSSVIKKTREERIEEAREWLDKSRSMLAFCNEMKDRAHEASAKEFAKAFKFNFKG